MPSSYRVVYLMRGLPACGKSHRARELAGEQGIVLETDEYFYTKAGSDPTAYDCDASLLPAARPWVFEKLQQAIADGVWPIVLDRGNGLNPETGQFAAYAVEHGYRVELADRTRDRHLVPTETIRRWMQHWRHDLTVE